MPGIPSQPVIASGWRLTVRNGSLPSENLRRGICITRMLIGHRSGENDALGRLKILVSIESPDDSSALSVIITISMSTTPERPAQKLIQHFKMEKILAEGPWFTVTYRSQDRLDAKSLPLRYQGDRIASTAIYAIQTMEDFSAMHKLL